jgi:hypothetical protein
MRKNLFRIILSLIFIAAIEACPFEASAAADTSVSPLAPNPNRHIRATVDSKHYKILVDIDAQLLTVFRQDENGTYTAIDRQMVCSTARKGKITGTGKYNILVKRLWLSSTNRGYGYEQYACKYKDAFWIHSTCYTKQKTDALERDSYLDLGTPASAGCIRLCVRDALWVYANCPNGTAVEIVKSGGPPAMCPGELPPLPDGATYDPTDPVFAR